MLCVGVWGRVCVWGLWGCGCVGVGVGGVGVCGVRACVCVFMVSMNIRIDCVCFNLPLFSTGKKVKKLIVATLFPLN